MKNSVRESPLMVGKGDPGPRGPRRRRIRRGHPSRRITSYNVCYTKLLRQLPRLTGTDTFEQRPFLGRQNHAMVHRGEPAGRTDIQIIPIKEQRRTDNLGNFTDAIAMAAEMGGLDAKDPRLIYPEADRKFSLFSLLTNAEQSLVDNFAPLYPILSFEWTGMQ